MNWIVCSHPHHKCVEETPPYQRTSTHPLPTAFLILSVHVHQCHSPPPTWLLIFGCRGQIQNDDVGWFLYCVTYFEVVTSVGHWRFFSWPIAADHKIDCNDNDYFDGDDDEDEGVDDNDDFDGDDDEGIPEVANDEISRRSTQRRIRPCHRCCLSLLIILPSRWAS